MRLLEGLEEYGHEMHRALQAMLKELFNVDVTEDEARKMTDKLSLSDVLRLDTAIENHNEESIADILGTDLMQMEYSLPGRAGLQSTASTRPTSQKRPGQTRYTPTSKPVAGGNKVATGAPAQADPDDEQRMANTAQSSANAQSAAANSAEIQRLKKLIGQRR